MRLAFYRRDPSYRLDCVHRGHKPQVGSAGDVWKMLPADTPAADHGEVTPSVHCLNQVFAVHTLYQGHQAGEVGAHSFDRRTAGR